MNLDVVILAAGLGTRMRSKIPKVLHHLAGQPLITYTVDLAGRLVSRKPVVVIGHGGEKVKEVLGDKAEFVWQKEQLGTGHALLQTRPLLEPRKSDILLLYADMPLVREETLRKLLDAHKRERAAITFLTVHAQDSMGFARVLRDAEGRVLRIIEEAEASEEEKRITELNGGVYCFDGSWLWEHLPQLSLHPKGEFYLTDLIGMAVEEGRKVGTISVEDVEEVLGINTRAHLARAEAVMRRRIAEFWMERGVTFLNPDASYIEASVQIGPDTVIYPDTYLCGSTRIGEDCRIGPNTIIRDSVIGNACVIEASVIEGSTLEDDVHVGPFSHLRPGSHLAQGVHIGNFAEVKKSYLGPGTKMGHFSYIGDAQVGPGVNIGAGTITCNFDGRRKHTTVIEEGAFIGSDTMLVAPVRVGAKAKTGAGSVVTRDIPPATLAYGVPARVVKSLDDEEEDLQEGEK